MEHKKPKLFLSIEEQIQLLRSKNLGIVSERSLEKYLLLYGYQTLVNGYNDPLMQGYNRHNDIYRDGATSEQLIGLFNFDRTISTYILSNLQNFERRFTTAMIIALGNELKNYQILDSTLFSINNSETWSHFFNSNFDNADRSSGDKEGIRHYWQGLFNKQKKVNLIKDYESVGTCPLYSLLLLATFGDKIDLYNSLQIDIQYKIRQVLFQQVSLPNDLILKNYYLFKYLLTEFKKLRNRCAHENVVYNFESRISNAKVLRQYIANTFDIPVASIKIYYLAKLLDIFLNQDSETRMFSNSLCSLITEKLDVFRDKYNWDDLTFEYIYKKLGIF